MRHKNSRLKSLKLKAKMNFFCDLKNLIKLLNHFCNVIFAQKLAIK